MPAGSIGVQGSRSNSLSGNKLERRLIIITMLMVVGNYFGVGQIYPSTIMLFAVAIYSMFRFYYERVIDYRLVIFFISFPVIILMSYYVSGTGYGAGYWDGADYGGSKKLYVLNIIRYILTFLSFFLYGNLIERNVFSHRDRENFAFFVTSILYGYLLIFGTFSLSAENNADRNNQYYGLSGYNAAGVWFLIFLIYFFSLLLRIRFTAKPGKIFLVLIMIALTFVVIGQTNAREAMICTVIGCIMYPILRGASIKAMLVILGFLGCFVAFGSGVILERFTDGFDSLNNVTGGSSTLDRLWLVVQWYDNLTWGRFLFGYGFGTCWPLLFPESEMECVLSAHNGYLQILGLGGASFFALVLFVTFGTFRRWCKNSPEFTAFIIAYVVIFFISDMIFSSQLFILLPLARFLLPPRGDAQQLSNIKALVRHQASFAKGA